MSRALKPDKLLTIGQVARLLRISPSSLRNWERLGLITPTRTAGRYRLYSVETVRQLKRIHFLRRVKRINPTGILHMRRQDTELLGVRSPDSADIGARLARMRKALRLPLDEAARRSGLSAASIARIERGASKPAVASLQKLTAIYGTSVLSFFENPTTTRALVRPRDRGVLADPGVRMELLAFGQLRMEAQLFRVAPRATSGGSYQHDGEEFIYMLSGKFEIWLDETERYVLEAGDSLYFPSTRTHRWGCVGDEEAVLLWINSPPTF
jgi:DNA-binding transcriptional MerR regulator/quercetin dioxygenase-like cupin family protein